MLVEMNKSPSGLATALLRAIRVWDDIANCFQTVEIPESLLKSSVLQELIEISEDSEEIIELPKEKVNYRFLVNIIRKESFSTLVQDYKAADFLDLPRDDILKKIGNHPDFDPEKLDYIKNIITPRDLNDENRKKLFPNEPDLTKVLEDFFASVTSFPEERLVEISNGIQKFLGRSDPLAELLSEIFS